jgi:cytochrome c oxidase subunit 4
MASPLLRLQTKLKPTAVAFQQIAAVHNRARIGNREVVGYGINGEYTYVDHIAFPMPAIRFRENTPEIQVRKSYGGNLHRCLFECRVNR